MNDNSTMMHIRVDKELKEQFEEVCENMRLTAAGATKIFIKAVVKENKIPFEVKG